MVRNFAYSAVSVLALASCTTIMAEAPATADATETAESSIADDVLKVWVDARAGTGAPTGISSLRKP